jgi:poly(3-hydroxybutyrate) depolymerase
MRQHLNLSEAAEKYGFVAVFPDAGSKQWNDGRPETAIARDDVGFLKSLVPELRKLGPIDPRNVNVVGISNGGMMIVI